MRCRTIRTPDGSLFIACGGRGRRPPPCPCGKGRADYLCDAYLDRTHTCDAKLCNACTTQGPDDLARFKGVDRVDYCGQHKSTIARWEESDARRRFQAGGPPQQTLLGGGGRL